MAKILVIEDIKEVRDTICKMLKRGGYEVIGAANGKEGLRLIEPHAPDAVVTDILMTEMDGLETIKFIVKTKPCLPVIAYTASANTIFLKAAVKFGAVSGLQKPFKQRELLSEVQRALAKKWK
ncbi:MAG: response regulator [bacterium]